MTTFFFQLQIVVYLTTHTDEKKYNSEIYEIFIDLFITLPICALIDNKYFTVHRGLSSAVKTVIYSDSIAHRKSQNKALYAIYCDPTL
jgi:hypothetical protein